MSVLLIALVATGTTILKNPRLAATSRNWITQLLGNPEAGYPPDKFRVDLVDRLNYQRMAARLPTINVDSELERWLDNQGAALDTEHLDSLTEQIRVQHPRYLKILACTAKSGNLQDLLGEFQDFSTKIDRESTHVAIHLTRLRAGLGYAGLVLTGRRLQDLTPELLTEQKTDTFFSTCPHCNFQHACKILLDQRGINLECPSCKLSYGVLAADEQGKFRYVNEFLTGYSPPAHFSYETNALHQMYTIWSAVVSHCKYVKDSSRLNSKRDTWQTALETQIRMHGDCEDSSIFLADWLITRGYQVRVALGHYGDMGGHAWCVAKVDGVDYLLESTEGPPDANKPPYVSDVGARYVPDTLFDRDAIFVRAKPKDRFNGDYWSSKNWIKVQPRKFYQEHLASVNGKNTKSGVTEFDQDSAKSKAGQPFGEHRAELRLRASPPFATVDAMKSLKEGDLAWQIPIKIATDTSPTGAKTAAK